MSRVTLPLLVEVGCEEIPARFLADSERQFAEHLMAALKEARLLRDGVLAAAKVHSYSTPRRLVAHAPSVLVNQPDAIEEITGPPAKIAFDTEGNRHAPQRASPPRQASEVKDLLQVETAKGVYLVARQAVQGSATEEVLISVLPAVIAGLTFPKSMTWEASGAPFREADSLDRGALGRGDAARVISFELAE